MKIDKMPTTIVLMVMSWLFVVGGLVSGGYFIIYKFNVINKLGIGILILISGLTLSALIRMFGNIGQMLFDMKLERQQQLQAQTAALNHSTEDLRDGLFERFNTLNHQIEAQTAALNHSTEDLRDGLFERFNTLNHQIEAQTADLQALKSIFEQLGCDLRDINQNINQIKTFFEQIQRHLDLKK